MNTPHPEIVAAYRKFSGNPTAQFPCHHFTAGFEAGVAAAQPPTEALELTQLQPLVMLKLTDAQAEELKKAMGIESGFDCPDFEAHVAGVKYSTPSTDDGLPDHGLPEKDMPPKMLRALIADLRATCAALRKQTGERGEIITRLRKERDASRAALKDVADQRDRFRHELAVQKKMTEDQVEQNAHVCRRESDAATALETAIQQAGKEAEAKHAALNQLHAERASHRHTQSQLRIAQAEAGMRPTPKPKPWTLSELWQLIQNRQSGIVSEEQFIRVLNSRPVG